MAPSLLLTVPASDGSIEQVSVGPDGVQTEAAIVTSREASVGAGLAGGDDGAASEDDFPLGIVIVVLLLIVVAAAAMVFGFRSTRRKRDTLDHHEGQHLRTEDHRPS